MLRGEKTIADTNKILVVLLEATLAAKLNKLNPPYIFIHYRYISFFSYP